MAGTDEAGTKARLNGGSTPVTARALWYEAPGRAALRLAELPPVGEGEARVRALHSVLSRGTERLVYSGQVAPSEFGRMRAPLQAGDFPFPVKYGYCAVGVVEAGPTELLGKTVFALHPHQDVLQCATSWLAVVPDGVPARRAVLAANMETALNALWDSGAGPGDRVAVVGGGVVGLLVAHLAARLPGADVTVVDPIAERAHLVAALGATWRAPNDAPADCDVAFHTSAHAEGLATALRAVGDEGTVVELSWYGAREVTIPLGCVFHSQRLKLVSSQVGKVSPGRRPRWTHARRLAKALELLRDPILDRLIDTDVPFDDLPDRLEEIFASRTMLTAVVGYAKA